MSFPQSPPSLSPVPSNRFDLTSGPEPIPLVGRFVHLTVFSLTLPLPQSRVAIPSRKLPFAGPHIPSASIIVLARNGGQ
jgi:hypothetical protein